MRYVRLLPALVALSVLAPLAPLAACGGGRGEAGEGGPAPLVPFDGPVYRAFTAFGGITDAAVDIYTYETVGNGPRHIVPTVADGSFGIPRYLVTPDTLIIVRVRDGMGSPNGGAPQENLGTFHAIFTPPQVEAETATVSFGTEALYRRLRHALATKLPQSEFVTMLHQRARCLLTDDIDGDLDEDADDVAGDTAGAVDQMYFDERDAIVSNIFAGDPIPYRGMLPLTDPKQPQRILTDTTHGRLPYPGRSLGIGDRAYLATALGVWVYRYDPAQTPCCSGSRRSTRREKSRTSRYRETCSTHSRTRTC